MVFRGGFKMKKILAILVLFFLVACAKKEIPTGAPPMAPSPQPVYQKEEEVPPTPPAEVKEEAAGELPSFSEEALEAPSEEWVEAHRRELELYGRSTRPLKAIFFDFDSFEIREDMKERLLEDARYLLEHPELKVELQGNCDERGSSEYNLALGERRALAVKRYLVNLGVAPERLTTVSFGEERPLDPGHNERAWALNRRVDLVVINR